MTNWKPISEFKPEIDGTADFLVWLPMPLDGPFIAQFGGMSVANDAGEPVDLGDKIVGEWRAMPDHENLEPVAFAEIDAYEPEGEAHLSEEEITHGRLVPRHGSGCQHSWPSKAHEPVEEGVPSQPSDENTDQTLNPNATAEAA